MDTSSTEDVALTRIPVWTAAALALAFAVYALDGAADALVYDRRAIASVELWRLLTGHWVHFSTTHLLYNALGLAVVGGLLEWRRERLYPALLLVTPAAIGIALFSLEPELARYGGLSGVVWAAAVYLALRGFGEGGRWRWVCGVFLIGLLGKLVLEIATGTTLLAQGALAPVPLGHAAGACVGAAFAWRQLLGLAARQVAAARDDLIEVPAVHE